MNPIDPSVAGPIPAPFWFIEFFKTLGFILHSLPMHLWLAGFPMALFLFLVGGANAKKCSHRFLSQLPFFMAAGINLGIVPLLFIQSAYGQVFYPTTILTAWHWFFVIPLMLLAYVLVYLTVYLSKTSVKWWSFFTGTVSVLALIVVGLIMTSNWSLMASPDSWKAIWTKTATAAAVSGLGTAWKSIVFQRFFQSIGLSFLTLSCWALLEAYFFSHTIFKKIDSESPLTEPVVPKIVQSPKTQPSKPVQSFDDLRNKKKDKGKLKNNGRLSEEEELRMLEEEINREKEEELSEYLDEEEEEAFNTSEPIVSQSEYQQWLSRFAFCIQGFGLAIAGASLWFYYYKILTPDMPNMNFLFTTKLRFLPMAVLAVLAFFLVIALLGWVKKIRGRALALSLFGADLILVSLWAVTRQLIQNAQIKDYFDVARSPQQIEWSPLIVFLILFVVGAFLIYWMLRNVVRVVSK